jgi:hypothetical protein
LPPLLLLLLLLLLLVRAMYSRGRPPVWMLKSSSCCLFDRHLFDRHVTAEACVSRWHVVSHGGHSAWGASIRNGVSYGMVDHTLT